MTFVFSPETLTTASALASFYNCMLMIFTCISHLNHTAKVALNHCCILCQEPPSTKRKKWGFGNKTCGLNLILLSRFPVIRTQWTVVDDISFLRKFYLIADTVYMCRGGIL